ncbi:MAG: hypothetical protein JJU26_02800 [Oceanicaulis sp.]|uniref:hypothetical protein n=1 Tax=Glycocaulis sp. TaxID=1969725 RepID=UPI0025C17DEC|nr:hypothetical protein [Glycocaulis sp.]MCC5980628.1 hypothetical protein [Oceanicaulis sp.]MCH8520463.1 hypothetical protein [Glycocaulis sp.]
MQRIQALLAALFLLAGLAAPASADEPQAFIALAQGLQAEAMALNGDSGTDETSLARTAQFAGDARALADWIQAEGGPVDLPCIFRGMAADVEARASALTAASDAETRAREYAGLAELFSHAVIFAGELEIESPANSFPPACAG